LIKNRLLFTAIHTSLEDYRLYFINQNLPITLTKSKRESKLVVKKGETSLPVSIITTQNMVFEFNSKQNELFHKKSNLGSDLFSNVCETKKNILTT
jgi:hypothetical protein